MRQVTTFVILTGAAALVACASHAPAPAAATGTSRAAAPASALPAQQQQPSAFSGYRRVVANGQELFCRNEAPTGSLIKQEICLTRPQLEALQSSSQQSLENDQHTRTCSAAAGLGGNSC